jgi:hypothetical protein
MLDSLVRKHLQKLTVTLREGQIDGKHVTYCVPNLEEKACFLDKAD